MNSQRDAREALIEAAKQLFIEKGFDCVSTRELAEAAGVNLGAIQYYFGSKANLFVQVVGHLMEGSGCVTAGQALQGEISSPQHAAKKLCHFIAAFLGSMLRHVGPQPCRLVFREIFASAAQDQEMFEALVSATVDDFIRPTDSALIAVLERIDQRNSDRASLELNAQSIIGQCSFYLTHGPFIERLRGKKVAESPSFERTVCHIASFSLRALGCDDRFIAEAISSQTVEMPPAIKAVGACNR